MEKEYQKINNIFEFGEKYRTILGIIEPYKSLKDLIWQGTEKIDGTNIRIYWDGHNITFAGRTNNADNPKELSNYLTKLFLTDEMEYVFEQIFGEKETYIFGEGFGNKIQSGGDYGEIGFIIFDINIDGFDLKRSDIDDIASRLGLPSVPVRFEGTLEEAIYWVSEHHMSSLGNGNHEVEGLVLVPKNIQLYDNKHKLIKCKCKYRDMLKSGFIEHGYFRKNNSEIINYEDIKKN